MQKSPQDHAGISYYPLCATPTRVTPMSPFYVLQELPALDLTRGFLPKARGSTPEVTARFQNDMDTLVKVSVLGALWDFRVHDHVT